MSVPVRLEDLTVTVAGRPLLSHVNATIPAKKIVVVVGPSGAGKSVLLRTIAGLIDPATMPVRIEGRVVLAGDDSPRRSPPRVGVVFQSFALLDEWSPRANVQLAIDHAETDPDSESPERSSLDWLETLGVPIDAPTSALSGGQKQRLAIARTLASRPEVVLYDEPTSGLDSESGRRVAELIRDTHRLNDQTSIVVTHDYGSLTPIADEIWLFDPTARELRPVDPTQWATIDSILAAMVPETIERTPPPPRPVAYALQSFFDATGSALIASVTWVRDVWPLVPIGKWRLRFFGHYLRLSAGFSAWVYLAIAGAIAGFVTTYFTFEFLPFRVYTQPLLIDDLLASIGFALYRILIPILGTILVAARTGAALAADVGVKQYGGQIDAIKTLGISPRRYLMSTATAAVMVSTPVLVIWAFVVARIASLVTFVASHGDVGPYFWNQHFGRAIDWAPASVWLVGKCVVCGIGIAAIAYHRGRRPKPSATAVSSEITATVLATTLLVLVVHFVASLLEF